jgi:hypothetical protein
VQRLVQQVPSFGKFFAGLSLTATDPASKKALQNKLLQLFDQFKGTDLSALNITADEFNQFLKDGADFLGLFSDSVNAATKSLLNMPTGINLAALEFQAQAAGGSTLLASQRGGSDGASLPMLAQAVQALATSSASTPPLSDQFGSTTSGVIQVNGPLYVYVTEAETDPLTLAQKIARRARIMNMAQTGNPTKAG